MSTDDASRLREALEKVRSLLTNLQPHIPQACRPGHEKFIDNYVDPAVDTIAAALTATPAASAQQEPTETKRRLREALEPLVSMCEVHGDFSNGVTDSTGTIDEGSVRAAEIIRAARAALSEQQAAPADVQQESNDADR